VLRRTVQACLGQLRNTDRIGRLAGDEFAILLPYTSQASAIQVAEKLREAIQQLRIPCRERIIKVTASLGIASLDCTTRDVETLLDHAAQALCSAKSAGRNRCMGTSNSTHHVDESRRRVLKAGRFFSMGAVRPSTARCAFCPTAGQHSRSAVRPAFPAGSIWLSRRIRSTSLAVYCRSARGASKRASADRRPPRTAASDRIGVAMRADSAVRWRPGSGHAPSAASSSAWCSVTRASITSPSASPSTICGSL
jgi:hypothetical protein